MEREISVPEPRVRLNLEVVFRPNYGRELSYGTLRNISLTGAFLELQVVHLDPNDKIKIHFEVSGRERIMQAEIVWVAASGCGVKFAPSNKRDIQIVDDLISYVESGRAENRIIMNTIFNKL